MKPIAHNPGYFITSDGRVWSEKRKRFLKPHCRDRSGHLAVNLCSHGKRKSYDIHHFVLEEYVGPCPPGMECRHLNGDPTDNQLKNLCWGTHKQNMADRVEHGTLARGERHGCAKLTEQQVRQLIYTYRTGLFSQKEIAEQLNVTAANVHCIINKKTWKHIWR